MGSFVPETHYAVMCLTRLAEGSCRCLLAALLEVGDGPANWLHVFELWLTGSPNCNSEHFKNFIHTYRILDVNNRGLQRVKDATQLLQ